LIPVGFSPEKKNSKNPLKGLKEEKTAEGKGREGDPLERVREILEELRKEEKTRKKLERAEKRLKKLPYCSREGHLALRGKKGLSLKGEVEFKEVLGAELKLEYVPHRCNSAICPICGYYESRKKYARVFELLEASLALDLKLAFFTLTRKPMEDPLSAVEWAMNIRTKAYNQGITKRFEKEIRKYLLRELMEFGRHLREKYPDRWRERLREEIIRLREHFGRIKTRYEELKGDGTRKGRVRIGDLYDVILKLEVHKVEGGWYPHWHGISLGYIPKVLLNAFWRYLTGGEGEITDIRKLKGKKAIAELSKYITKPVNSKLTDFTNIKEGGVYQVNKVWVEEKGEYQTINIWVSYEELLLLEYALYGRKKLVVWGSWKELEKRLREEEKENAPEREEEVFHLYKVYVDTKTPMFHIPKALRKARQWDKEVLIGEGRIDLSPFITAPSEELAKYSLKELGEISQSHSFVSCKLYAVPEGYIKVEVPLKGRELEIFKELLWVALKSHRKWEEFINPSKREGGNKTPESGEDIVSQYEGLSLPDHLEEQIDVDIDLFGEI